MFKDAECQACIFVWRADVTVPSGWWEVAVWRRGLDGGAAFQEIRADCAEGLISLQSAVMRIVRC